MSRNCNNDCLSGQCLCGTVSWTLTKKNDKVEEEEEEESGEQRNHQVSPFPFIGQLLVCHCTMCRRVSGSMSGVPYLALPKKILWDQLHRCHDSGTKDTDHDNTNSNSSSNNNNKNDNNYEEKEHSVIQRYTSSSVASRGFCKKCGTTIYMDYGEPHTIWIPIGIVNDVTVEKVQDWIRLRVREEEPRDSHIFTESKATGITELLQQKLPFMENFGSFIYDSCNPKKGHEKKTLTKKPSEIKMEPPFVFKGIDDIAKHVENLKQKEKQEEQTKE